METTKEDNESLIEWRKKFEQDAKYDYAQTHYQGKEDSEYIQSVSAHSRVYGMNSFKEVLKEAIEQERELMKEHCEKHGMQNFMNFTDWHFEKILSLLSTLRPIK